MEGRKKLYCHYENVRFMTEEIMIKEVGSEGVVSLSEHDRVELMIFLGQEKNTGMYEVRIYKAKPKNNYIPCLGDDVVEYYETTKYVSLFFKSFESGINFIALIPYRHSEFLERVVKKNKTLIIKKPDSTCDYLVLHFNRCFRIYRLLICLNL